MEPVEAARAFIQRHFPECDAAFLAGSFLRGEATPTSDLDIVVVTDHPDAPYRASFREQDWPIEAFIHTERSLHRYLAMDVQRRRPSLPFMCEEGVILRNRDGLADRVKEEAHRLLARGPEPLSEDEIERRRYAVTDLLDDFLGVQHVAEGIFVACDLATTAADLILGYKRSWTGSGKWIPRALARVDPELSRSLTSALMVYCRTGTKEELLAFVESALAPVGGRLFEGYQSRG